MPIINNTVTGGPFDPEFGKLFFWAINPDGYVSGSSGSGKVPKQVRGKVKKITVEYTLITGTMPNVGIMRLDPAGYPVSFLTASAASLGGSRYRATFEGVYVSLIDSFVSASVYKNIQLIMVNPNNLNSNTFGQVNISVEYDFTREIYAVVTQPDPNIAEDVKVKVDFREALEPGMIGWYLDTVYYESTLSFPGHSPVVKNGPGRTISYNKADIKAIDGSLSVQLYRLMGTVDNPSLFSPINTLAEPVTFTPAPPIVHGLEPDGIDVNIQTPKVISWHSDKQTKFTLKINDTQYTGTNERSLTVPANTLIKGVNRLNLEVWNGIGSTTVTATFRGYGKPTLPIFDSKNIYNAAKPKIKWTTDEQHIYQFQIFKGIEKIYDTGEVISSAQEHQVTQILENKTTYTVKVKVKNDKGLWSDLAQKDIEISYVALEPATLTLFETNSQIVINVNNPENEAFAKCEVYRKTAYTPWRRIAKNAPIQTSFADNLIASNTEYSYKVISYDKQGGATESEIKTAKIKLKTEQFINLDGMEFLPRVYTTKDTGFTLQKVQDKTIMKFEGMTAPMIESGEKDYSVLKCSAAFLNFEDYKQFKYIADNAQVIMFRSALGHLIYGQVTSWGDESAISSGLVTINFTFTEVNFIESEIYDGGMTLRIIRLDAGYKLDAGYELDGYYHE